MRTSLLVIGAGAAGLMAAGTAANEGVETLILERNERPARKLMITGKGRCNVTNNCNSLQELISNVPRNGRFLYGAFSRFMPADVIDFFESRGVELKTERGNRVFPVSDNASDIVDALHSYARNRARIMQGRAVELIKDGDKLIGVRTDDGIEIYAESIIVATGGLSYPGTGSTGDGYELARRAGHNITDLVPSLVPLEIHEGFCTDLMGLSLRNTAIKVVDADNGKTVYTDFGEMLFTHFGVSGPMILSASAHMRNMKSGKYKIYIDLKPALTPEQLDARILRDFSENINRNFINALNSLLPKKLVPVIVKLSKIPLSTKVNQITKEQRQNLVQLLKGMCITVTGFRPVAEAIITSGGVDVSQINPKTMESKLVDGLYFAGEVIDADAYTGGFNLQIAFSTGRLAALSAAEKIKENREYSYE
ncbi:MAG: NAD(P)/FAD-dependent oxidoreductase [Acutalibacteraceae bacterium]|nr:NAD(P)/FAD-dependent oxidoreductase [Acutalibacteraceae bacterium]